MLMIVWWISCVSIIIQYLSITTYCLDGCSGCLCNLDQWVSAMDSVLILSGSVQLVTCACLDRMRIWLYIIWIWSCVWPYYVTRLTQKKKRENTQTEQTLMHGTVLRIVRVFSVLNSVEDSHNLFGNDLANIPVKIVPCHLVRLMVNKEATKLYQYLWKCHFS